MFPWTGGIPLGCPLQNNQPLLPVHNTNLALLSPHHLPKTLYQLHALDRLAGCRAREETSFNL